MHTERFGEHLYARFSETITDLPNRLMFYPLARLLLPLAVRTGVTPTQVTLAHMILALLGAGLVLLGTSNAFYIAFACFFVRAVLDCLDGVLARFKNMTSISGRIMDELSDTVAFLALCATMGIHIAKTQPAFPVISSLVLLALGAALNASAWDFYRRKIVSVLKTAKDSVMNDLVEKHRILRREGKRRLLYFGLLLEWFQILVFAPKTIGYVLAKIRDENGATPSIEEKIPTPEADYILKRVDRFSFKVLLLSIAFLCGDNIFLIFVLGLLSSVPADFITYCLFYSAITLLFGVLYINYFLRDLQAEPHLRHAGFPKSN